LDHSACCESSDVGIEHSNMALPPSLQVALKEWAVVCQALGSGRQIILLRKGGIQEAAGGFELEYPRFLLFPTYLHQNAQMLKPDAARGLEPQTQEPATITISQAGEVTDILRLQSRAQMQAIDTEHIWADPLIDMRFNYRPWNPLYLLLVRVYRLPEPVQIENTAAYAGCKSWVPLEQPISCEGAAAVLSDAGYVERRARIVERVSSVIAAD
jgi:hypothetical protein